MLAVVALSFRFRGSGHRLVMVIPGAVLLAVSAIIGLWGVIGLGRGLTPFPRPLPHMPLIQTGIYGVVRHPLYTSVMVAALGWALVWQSWPGLLAGLALIPYLDLKSRREERWLRDQFPEYSEYAKRVRRFIPGVY
ncbi:MAG TPA: isoprenylcysteine carboxylmethyltransferase family protein [Verrucomicrobiae bacterium]|nr:isoprenylcysteine carboxylmethyltransferase family protein [Verrucomicrobiae bacterium]